MTTPKSNSDNWRDGLEFRPGDIIAEIGTDVKATVVCASSGYRRYYLHYFNGAGNHGIWEDSASETDAEYVEQGFVLVEREGEEDE